jgi:hypothetical protein
MAQHEVVIPQLEIDPELTEADTMAALGELRAWYEEYAITDTLELQAGYSEQQSRYNEAVADILDDTCTDGTLSSQKDLMGTRYTATTHRVDADITDDRFDYMNTVRATFRPVHRDSFIQWDSTLDDVAHRIHPEWHWEVKDLPGDELGVFGLEASRHVMVPVQTNERASGVKLTHTWDGGQQHYVADKDPAETHKLERFDRWEETRRAAFRALSEEKVVEALSTAEYGQLLRNAAAYDRSTYKTVTGSYVAYNEAATRVCRPGTWDRDELDSRIGDLVNTLARIDEDDSFEGLSDQLMRPDIIQTARLALAYSEQYSGKLVNARNITLTKRLEWVLYYAPRLQYDAYCLMANDDARRQAINRDEVASVREKADAAVALYDQVMADTMAFDPRHWTVEQ